MVDLKWVDSEIKPTEPGMYLVEVEGGSEHDDMGGLIYEYGPYVDQCYIEIDPGDGSLVLHSLLSDVDWEWVRQWFGPIPKPDVIS